MKFYPSVLVTWMILAADNAWANAIRGSNSNHISHGQNDIRQLNGSGGVNVTVTADVVGNDVTVVGNSYGDVRPTPTAPQTPVPTTAPTTKPTQCIPEGDACVDDQGEDLGWPCCGDVPCRYVDDLEDITRKLGGGGNYMCKKEPVQ